MKAYITIGLPGSGKSFKAKKLCSENPNLVRVNRDNIRLEILKERGIKVNWHNALDKKIESETTKRQDEAIKQASRDGKDVIVDNCHLSDHIQKKIVWFLQEKGYSDIELIDCRDVPLETCLERNEQRKGETELSYVNPAVIKQMHSQHILKENKPVNTFMRNLPNWEPLEHTPNCIIVDVDGTLAAIRGRSPYDETRVFEDSVRTHVVATINALANSGTIDHVFVFSGRTNGCRQDTERWLLEKAEFPAGWVNCGWSLHMRTVGDQRPDAIIKTELFNQFINGKFSVLAVFDDRAKVIRDCWKPLNVPVFRCGVIDEDDF